MRRWNDANRSGCAVEVTLDDGRKVLTTTRTEAWVLSGHTAVVLLESIPEHRFSGCFALDRVRAIDSDPRTHLARDRKLQADRREPPPGHDPAAGG